MDIPKLWLLIPFPEWSKKMPMYDVSYKYIISAKSSEEARQLAQNAGGDEIHKFSYDTLNNANYDETIKFWTDPQKTSCVELVPSTNEIIARCFNAG